VALADFVAPKGCADHIGAFVVTAGIGEDEVADRFKNANDDYSSIMVKRWPIASPRPLPNGCTRRCARSSGLRRRRDLEQRRSDRGEVPRHPPGAGLSGAADHTEKGTLFGCSTASGSA